MSKLALLQVILQNTRNGAPCNETRSDKSHYFRGTRDFSVSVSTDLTYWEQVARGELPKYKDVGCPNQRGIAFEFEPRRVKYVRFVAESYYGAHGAGLQFFDVQKMVEDKGGQEDKVRLRFFSWPFLEHLPLE